MHLIITVYLMARQKISIDISAVDYFLARPKTLKGDPPIWIVSARTAEMSATWPISDDLGVEAGHLRFKFPRGTRGSVSVSVIFGGDSIWRVDLATADECKFNLYDAYMYGLPPRVCGPHEHAWPDNRDYVKSNGFGQLPYRRPIEVQLRRSGQLLPWIAGRIGLILDPYQRAFDDPPQTELFRAENGM
jgi:hypothetical protein